MKKMLAIVMTFAVLFGIFSVAFAAENGAVDSIESVQEAPEGYTAIRTAEDLNNIRNDLAGKYLLMNDIDLSVYENWVPIGDAENPFTGELDGNGYVIENLTIVAECNEENNYIGLFGVGEKAKFLNIIIENGNISAKPNENSACEAMNAKIGMLAGYLIGSTSSGWKILSSSATGKIKTDGFDNISIGGLVGELIGTYFVISSSSYVDINVKTDIHKQNISAAGICGLSTYDFNYRPQIEIKNTANFGDIIIDNIICSEESSLLAAGVLNNYSQGVAVENCINYGGIYTTAATGEIIVAGIQGNLASCATAYCCNFGEISVPLDDNDIVCAICGITGEYVSFGSLLAPCLTNCYYTNKDLPSHYKYPEDASTYDVNIHIITEEQAKQQETFSDLDFENTWYIDEDGHLMLLKTPTIKIKKNIEIFVGKNELIKTGKKYITDTENVVTIDEEGRITAVSKGEVTITVEHDCKYYTEYTVTVTEEETTTEPTTKETTEPATETTTETVEISTTIPEPSTTEKEETMQSTTAPVTEPETQPSTVPEPTTEPAIEPTTATEETTTEPSDDEKCPLEDCQLIKFLKQFFNFVCEILCEIVSRIV